MSQLQSTPPIGARIRDLRMERGVRQAELARAVRCHPKTIARIEKGTRGVSDVLLRRIARELGHDYTDLQKATARSAA